jgi:maleate isomerase
MSVAYAPKGLTAVLTPQANTTVEPELAILTPPGHAFINARLTSEKATIPDRLRDYFDDYDKAASQFANAPVGSIGFACTGASYLAGVAREDATLAALQDRLGIPVATAATAVIDALTALGAEKIALLSPYGAALDDASEAYWRARGQNVVARVSAFESTDAFHPIYSMSRDRATQSLGRWPMRARTPSSCSAPACRRCSPSRSIPASAMRCSCPACPASSGGSTACVMARASRRAKAFWPSMTTQPGARASPRGSGRPHRARDAHLLGPISLCLMRHNVMPSASFGRPSAPQSNDAAAKMTPHGHRETSHDYLLAPIHHRPRRRLSRA